MKFHNLKTQIYIMIILKNWNKKKWNFKLMKILKITSSCDRWLIIYSWCTGSNICISEMQIFT